MKNKTTSPPHNFTAMTKKVSVIICLISVALIAGGGIYINFGQQKKPTERILEETAFEVRFDKLAGYEKWNYEKTEETVIDGINEKTHTWIQQDSTGIINIIPRTYFVLIPDEKPGTIPKDLEEDCMEMGGENIALETISYQEKERRGVICEIIDESGKFVGIIIPIALDKKNMISATLTSFEENYEENKKDLEYILSQIEIVPKK